RFWRAEKSRSRQTGGSGLGLAIVRQLAEAHGGSAAVRSEPDRGATFVLRLPRRTKIRDYIDVPSHDIDSSPSGLAGVGREALGERDDEVAQFIGALDDERPVE
ncbi:ATP-binding protein, partial [Nonomuraea sp. JJY05]